MGTGGRRIRHRRPHAPRPRPGGSPLVVVPSVALSSAHSATRFIYTVQPDTTQHSPLGGYTSWRFRLFAAAHVFAVSRSCRVIGEKSIWLSAGRLMIR